MSASRGVNPRSASSGKPSLRKTPTDVLAPALTSMSASRGVNPRSASSGKPSLRKTPTDALAPALTSMSASREVNPRSASSGKPSLRKTPTDALAPADLLHSEAVDNQDHYISYKMSRNYSYSLLISKS